VARRPQARTGTYNPYGDGRIRWKDEEGERPGIRIVRVTEREDLKQRGLL